MHSLQFIARISLPLVFFFLYENTSGTFILGDAHVMLDSNVAQFSTEKSAASWSDNQVIDDVITEMRWCEKGLCFTF